MENAGKTIFWAGFVITLGIVIAYVIISIISIASLATWVTSISLCGIVLIGAILMLWGRSLERRAESRRR